MQRRKAVDHVTRRRPRSALIACLAVAAALPLHAQSEPAAEQEIAAPDVFEAVRDVHLKLVALRHVTDRPPVEDTASFMVFAATLRHVYYAARELFRKTHQLTEEIAGDRRLPLEAVDADWRRGAPRPLPEGREVMPSDVLRLVEDADDRLAAALALLNVRIVLEDSRGRDAEKQPVDALVEIMKINRQLNRMMDRRLRMKDVYAQALQAINYAGDLGAGYPALTAAEGGRRPLDVYQRLIACLHLIRQVGAALNVETLDWEDSVALRSEDVAPDEVYDLANTIASELEYMALHVDAEHTSPPRGEYRLSQEALPAHVFRLVGVLEQQLRFLIRRTEAEDVGAALADAEAGDVADAEAEDVLAALAADAEVEDVLAGAAGEAVLTALVVADTADQVDQQDRQDRQIVADRGIDEALRKRLRGPE